MGAARLRNVVFKLALIVLSVALAAFGVFGWADAAHAFDAYRAGSWEALDPLWPIYAIAAIACVAAQIVAACAVVNFARLAGAPLIWRFLAGAFYAVAVFFAAYSADGGARVILTSAHRAVYTVRETERRALSEEIKQLSDLIDAERQKLPQDTSGTVTSRQQIALARFQAVTATAGARLPEAQAELARKPPISREEAQPWVAAAGVFLIFLAWAVLEPWGYALAERGREPNNSPPSAKFAPHAKAPWLRRVAGWIALAWFSQTATQAPIPEAPAANPLILPEPVQLSDARDAKAAAFSMRGRFAVQDIAAKVGVHQATVYRWFRARDLQANAA